MGTSGPGADAHNLRACDVQRNGSRGNKKFATGTGLNSGTVGANWYPGDNWKGDVSRIVMYMYLRYTNQCKPSSVFVGNPVGIDVHMVDLLLEWNAADPVDNFEIYRNEIIQQNQGNRNPFIDNPFLATLIWGGTPALNTWNLTINETENFNIKIYPNPIYNSTVFIEFSITEPIDKINIFNTSGQLVRQITPNNFDNNQLKIEQLPSGLHFIQIKTNNGIITQKIVVE